MPQRSGTRPGEFLELLRDRGIPAEGVDLNGQMAGLCLDKGLLCERKDILEKLAEQDNDSLGGVFSSQVVEHLPPDYLRSLIQVAHLKLAPGGALVLETVNPTSVFALVQIYFLDLSHEKPLHPQALKYLVESAGFKEAEVLYSEPLQEERLQPLPGADLMAEYVAAGLLDGGDAGPQPSFFTHSPLRLPPRRELAPC